ncbi:MAG: hypothetical protein ACI84K_001884 [Pseudohongiellaceae bacterium]|jgi:hypothetical protein
MINITNAIYSEKDQLRPMKRNIFLLIIGLILFAFLTNLAFAHGMSEEEKNAIIGGGNLQYMWLGATHMLSGYDHLAFVFGIIFFLTTFRDIAKYVTAFTLGHSITLIYATFNAIQLNYFLIDAVIALSVCYIAFANIDGFRKYLSIAPPNMMMMIIGLGLIHGFGLSTRLQELPLSEDGLLLNIISFNIGIEFGQISALFIMLLLVAAWRKTQGFKTFSLIANYALISMGVFLFFMQMHGYEHSTNADELVIVQETSPQTGDSSNTMLGKLENEHPSQWKDSIEVVIPARGEKEYKLFLTKGATFKYTWQTKGEELFFDFHGEPADDTTGYFKSFKKSTESQSSGSLTSVFEGTHGWYWKNSTRLPVTISLKVNGEYQLLDKKKPSENTIPNPITTHQSIDSL